MRFETPPGQQSQIDWGTARVHFRNQRVVLHWFILTLGYSRRGFQAPFFNERLPQFLDAHEQAFDYFGGHTREHLYDRPRTVCARSTEAGRPIWNPTFKSFADYWGFEPRLCRPYRALTKGKVESGVKYLKRNFLVGRTFVDLEDVREQLGEWNPRLPMCGSTAPPMNGLSIASWSSASTSLPLGRGRATGSRPPTPGWSPTTTW